jgi:hypothetical protein
VTWHRPHPPTVPVGQKRRQELRDLRDRLAIVEHPEGLLDVVGGELRQTPTLPTTGTGGGEPFEGVLADDVELVDRGEDVKRERPAGVRVSMCGRNTSRMVPRWSS